MLFIYKEAREALSLCTEWHYALWTDQLRKRDRTPDGDEMLRQKAEMWDRRLRRETMHKVRLMVLNKGEMEKE